MTDIDKDLRQELERILKLVKSSPPWSENSILAKELNSLALLIDAKFKIGSPDANLWASGGRAVRGFTLVHPLFEIAKREGVEVSLDRLVQFYRPRVANVEVCFAVVGADPVAALDVTPKIKLMPAKSLAQSTGLKWVLEMKKHGWLNETGNSEVTAVAIHELSDFPYICEEHDTAGKLHMEAQEILVRAIRGFTMAGPCAPAPSWSWTEVPNPEPGLEVFYTAFNAYSHRASEGIGHYRKEKPVTEQDAQLVSKYLSIHGPLARKLDIAMDRLNLSQCRLSVGNKAIEASIGLEALLGSRDEKEGLAHRYSLRAALLLAADYEKRKGIRRTIKDLYTYRSKIVHGSDPNTTLIEKKQPNEVVTEGIGILARLIRHLVELGVDPDWDKIELARDLGAAQSSVTELRP